MKRRWFEGERSDFMKICEMNFSWNATILILMIISNFTFWDYHWWSSMILWYYYTYAMYVNILQERVKKSKKIILINFYQNNYWWKGITGRRKEEWNLILLILRNLEEFWYCFIWFLSCKSDKSDKNYKNIKIKGNEFKFHE